MGMAAHWSALWGPKPPGAMQRRAWNANRNMPELAIGSARALIGLRPPFASLLKDGISLQVRVSSHRSPLSGCRLTIGADCDGATFQLEACFGDGSDRLKDLPNPIGRKDRGEAATYGATFVIEPRYFKVIRTRLDSLVPALFCSCPTSYLLPNGPWLRSQTVKSAI